MRDYPTPKVEREVKLAAHTRAVTYVVGTEAEVDEADAALEALLLKHGLMTPNESIEQIEQHAVEPKGKSEVFHCLFIKFEDNESIFAILCDAE